MENSGIQNSKPGENRRKKIKSCRSALKADSKYDPKAELYAYLSKTYSRDAADAVAGYMNTDYTAGRLLSYIRQAHPGSFEQIVDEMLSILEGRQLYVDRQIEKKRKIDVDDLFVRGFDIDWNQEDVKDSYLTGIPALSGIEHFYFNSNITFFVGENGTGKSTLLEALAIACGQNPEGGTGNYRFSTYDDYSDLSKAIHLIKGACRPKKSYFLRAETFYNVASALMTKYNDDGRMDDLHVRSHGESFMDFILKADKPGLYFLDEPEAALSPQRQLSLLIHLVKTARAGAQYIIVTHSPILLAIPEADIWSFDEGEFKEISYEETESYQITKMFLENRERMIRRLLAEEEM